MSNDHFQNLRNYCLTPALAGFEDQMIKAMVRDLRPYVDSLNIDVLGNVITKIDGKDPKSKSIMVFAHMDSLGLIVKGIAQDGFIKLERVGGVPERILAGAKVVLQPSTGDLISGVIGIVSHHLTPPEDKYIVKPISELYVDIGATNIQEVQSLGIKIGTPVLYQPSYENLQNGRIAATSLDDRGGCAILVELAKVLSAKKPNSNVFLVATVQEEFNLRGAMVAAQQIMPDAAISLDLVAATDTPDINNGASVRVGMGPVLGTYSFHGRGTLNGLIPHPGMVKLVEDSAQRKKINLQRHATVGLLTDASYVQLVGKGVACVDLAWPTRYTHSGVEVSSLQDLEDLSHLVADVVYSFSDNTIDSRFQD